MTINKSGLGADNALIQEIRSLRREHDELRTTPQPIGNGSINYAKFAEFNLGPFSIPSGFTANASVMFANITLPFYYDGKLAINKITLSDLYWTVCVDAHDVNHAVPYGAALVGPERSPVTTHRYDYYQSGLSDVNGQMYVTMQITNTDTVTHNYWIDGRMMIPRPALKPQ